jgi:large subunit ribosomal protein L13
MQVKRAKTFSQKKAAIVREWHLLDGKDQVLGRLASQIATILQGKDKPSYTPHLDGGDYLVLINAGQIVLTRGKETKKVYVRHSNYPGGLSKETFAALLKRNPEAVIKLAVKGMLPDNRLRAARLERLKVFTGAQHTYQNYLK